MRKRRLLLAAGASLATVALTVGTALADPPVSPPPSGTIIGVGAQTTQGLLNDLCNTGKVSPVNCASYDVDPQPSNITTKPTPPANCTFARPSQGGGGFDALIARPTCVDFARVVTDADKATRPTGFTYIPIATDALTYAFRADGTVPPDLDIPTLKKIYTCDPAFTTGPNAFKPLIGIFKAGNRTLFLQTLGIPDGTDLTTRFPCIHDGFLANDGRVLTDPRQLITYSSAPYFAQLNQVEQDIHGPAVLGGINGIPPEVLNDQSTISRPVFDVVRTGDTGSGPIHDLFVGSGSKACTNSTTIQQHGFNTRADCGATTDVTTN